MRLRKASGVLRESSFSLFLSEIGKISVERKVLVSSAYCKFPKSRPLCTRRSGARCSSVDPPIQCMVLLILDLMHVWLKILSGTQAGAGSRYQAISDAAHNVQEPKPCNVLRGFSYYWRGLKKIAKT
jgi:hypothetical protein